MLHASDILQKDLKTVGITVYLIFIALRYSVYKMHYNSYANSNNKSNGKKNFENSIVAKCGQHVRSSPISGPLLETMWRTVPPFSLFLYFISWQRIETVLRTYSMTCISRQWRPGQGSKPWCIVHQTCDVIGKDFWQRTRAQNKTLTCCTIIN